MAERQQEEIILYLGGWGSGSILSEAKGKGDGIKISEYGGPEIKISEMGGIIWNVNNLI